MAHAIHDLGHGFWTIRGDFRIAGVLNVGTQAALVQLASGDFVLLDSYPLSGQVQQTVMRLTDQGRAVKAVLNLHPFHTLHCETTAQDFPNAALYGSKRHHQRYPHLNWQPQLVESPYVQEMFSDDLTFSLPRGIEYISAKDHIHAGSLLAWHRASSTLHVDDTISLLAAPKFLRGLLPRAKVFLHPTLPKALLPQPDAVEEFSNWIKELSALTHDLRWLCAAHSGYLRYDAPGEFSRQLLAAWTTMRRKLNTEGLKSG